ncbi:MAG: hypothetical protein RB288_00375 [Bacteroidales bacterium]|jgi:hypothetical protein|nr:hypothetical protein [Bacteroidales bacterium]
MKKITLIFLAVALPVLSASGQGQFSGDTATFTTELNTFMGTLVSKPEKAEVDLFISLYDSTCFSHETKDRIINVASQLRGRRVSQVPGFIYFVRTLTDFVETNQKKDEVSAWLEGLSEMAFDPRFTNASIEKFIEVTGLLLVDNTIYAAGSVRWKTRGGKLEFVRDTVLKIDIRTVTLIGFLGKDSTEIYNFSGTYYPDVFRLRCGEGTVTWEKAGYDPSKVFARVKDFDIDVTKSEFTCDSSLLTHPDYFREPVMGKLTDRAVEIASPDKATMPRFETYENRFFIEDIYKDVDYEGGLALEGAIVRGTGTNWLPASISLYRNDTLAVHVSSRNFLLSQKSISSYDASSTLFLDRDSIYHSSLGFSYNATTREVGMFRTNSPLSRSPYFDSYHNLDLYFEHLSWDMDDPFITMSRTRGSSIGAARFESVSFYNEANFFRLMRFDEVHPLYRIRDYGNSYGYDVFPVGGLAKWLRMPVEQATALCIELANNGFLFYDRNFNEVAIKPKVDDYIASFAKKKDYDAISIYSETRDEEENAILNLNTFELDIRGVRAVSLSDSQNVALRPYGGRLVVGKNRSISFDGMVQAGLFTIYGKQFSFSYDTFSIFLDRIDSLKIAVETEERDAYGRPVIKRIDNMIEMASARLLIDDPRNKSGLKSLSQYPIINSTKDSYIFYDEIKDLDGLYEKEKFYFKLDPFTYNNIDHYTNADMALSGEFVGGGIIEPMRQVLTVQPDTSLGFTMTIPPEGIPIYNGRGTLYNHLSMSNSGLIGSGSVDHLTATAVADTFRFFPEFMVTRADRFTMKPDTLHRFPELSSRDVDIQWLTATDEWYAQNSEGEVFDMFGNGTTMEGTLVLKPDRLEGSGQTEMADSRITSETFSFGAMTVDADTSDYYLKALRGSGYGFVASNAKTHVDFTEQRSDFSLNTDSSFVVFPGIEYLSRMTNFEYDMESKVLDMWQKGRESTTLLPADQLLRVPPGMEEKPTFLSTNNMKDTVKFQSGSASYYLQDELLEVRDVNYIPVADALVQPGGGVLYISRGALIRETDSALVAINNRHLIHSARINIESSANYSGSGKYDYTDETGESQVIEFSEIRVDTMATKAMGYIPESQNFTLSPAFTFSGDVSLRAAEEHLRFTGSAGIVTACENIGNMPVKFSAMIDPMNILIPVDEKPRDRDDNLLFSGTFITLDSTGVYGTFLSPRKSWSDNPLLTTSGLLFHDRGAGQYHIASLEKLADRTLHGNIVSFDRNFCILRSEGKIDFGVNYDRVKIGSAGLITHNTDSSKVRIQTMLGLSFHYSAEALELMAGDIRTVPTLRTVNLSTEFNSKAMRDLIGVQAARTLNEELQLFGVARSLPKEYSFQMLINDVTLVWNASSMSFISEGKIGVGFIGNQPLNVYVDGWVELQRKRSGDLLDIYLKADNNVWYWFSYFRGIMMSYSSNTSYNDLLNSIKEKERRDPGARSRDEYQYMIGLPDRLQRFLRRMESGGMGYEEDPYRYDQ